MEYRQCGNFDLKLPVLGIGCWSFGGGDYWGEQKQDDVDRIVAKALECGCSYFDTAEVYNDGDSEISLGKALKERRSKAVIGSKVSPIHAYPNALRSSCEGSLRRLGTDYIDLYMMHWPIHTRALRHYTSDSAILDNPPDIRLAFETMTALQKEGKIRYIGVSNFGVTQLTEVLEMGFDISVNQLGYNMLFRAPEDTIFPLCAEKQLGVISYMPLMQGLLSGKYDSIEDIPAQRTRTRQFRGDREGSRHGEQGHEAILNTTLAQLKEIADNCRQPLHRLALAWLLTNPIVNCTIFGVRTTEQLVDNLQSIEIDFDKSIMVDLNAATVSLKNAIGGSLDLFEASENSRSW